MLSFKPKFCKRLCIIAVVILWGIWFWDFSRKGKHAISLFLLLFGLRSRFFPDFRFGSVVFPHLLLWFFINRLIHPLFCWLSGLYIFLFDLCSLFLVFPFFSFDHIFCWFFILWWKSGTTINVYVLSFFISLHFLIYHWFFSLIRLNQTIVTSSLFPHEQQYRFEMVLTFKLSLCVFLALAKLTVILRPNRIWLSQPLMALEACCIVLNSTKP